MWSKEQSKQAESEGWDIFTCEGSVNGYYQIQMIDEQNKFKDDVDVWEMLVKSEKKLHIDALVFIAINNPTEFKAIIKHTKANLFGYSQSRNRYHWKINDVIILNQGFRSKNDCDNWIQENRNRLGFDWRAGFMLKWKSQDQPWVLVNKKGEEVKCF
jgi:hypothetical protein